LGRITADEKDEPSAEDRRLVFLVCCQYNATDETDRQVVNRAAELADQHRVPRAHIALAWLLQKKQPVTEPISGVTKSTHVDEAVGALSVHLTREEVASLEGPYVPHRIVGHQ
jgi:aryl-alcohol dehydrogenase-like predicted oxidoreductase